MQIKYIKDAPLGKTGDIADIAPDQAHILIGLGYAKKHQLKAKTDKPSDQPTDTATDQPTDSE